MAASAIVSDHDLEERIYQLQKMNLDAGPRQILEEAAQLCGDGRHLEASALVEKAEAMSSVVAAEECRSAGPLTSETEEAEAGGSVLEEPLAARLVTDIADGLAKVLVGAIQDLERRMTGETRRMTSIFGQRLDKLQGTVESLQPLNERLDNLAQAGAAVQEKYEQLAATTARLQEADANQSAEIGALRLQMQELSASTINRMDEACRRIEGQEREISTADSLISGLTSRIATAAERLERHADAIRALHQEHHQRATALDQVAEVLGRVRTAPEHAQITMHL